MKKSVSINIRGILLYIEEDGYEVLQAYLHKINQYFAHYEGRKEIVEDIESRIAEIFLGKLSSYKQVIDLEDVQALIAQMGDVSDFEMAETEEELLLAKEAPQGKKLFRENKNKVIAGVAGGLASYFGVRDLLLRILFVLLTPLWGLGLWLYLLLWLLVPAAKSITDRVAMRGEAITLNNIEHNLKYSLGYPKEENRVVKILMAPFHLLARILAYAQPKVYAALRQISRWVAKTWGIFLSGFAIIAFMLATLAALIAFRWVNGEAYWEAEMPLEVLLNGIENLHWITVFSYLGIICLTLLLFLIGIGLIAKKTFLNSSLAWGLPATSFVCLIIFLLLLPQTMVQFRKQHIVEQESSFTLGKGKILNLNISPIEREGYLYPGDFIDIQGYEGRDIKVIKSWQISGRNRAEALQELQKVDYQVAPQDTSLLFDPNITFKKNAKYREQRLSLKILVPYRQKFAIAKGLQSKTSLYLNTAQAGGQAVALWFFTEKGLECEGCERPVASTWLGERMHKFSPEAFQAIDVSGNIDLQFKASENFEVHISSNLATVSSAQGLLSIVSHTKTPLQVVLYAPSLRSIKLSQQASASFDLPFTEQLQVQLSQDASLQLSGQSRKLQVQADGFCKLEAQEWRCEEATVDLSNHSKACLQVAQKLLGKAKQNSCLSYRGNPTLDVASFDRSVVRQYEQHD